MMFFLTISPSKLIVLSLDFSKSISIYLISPSQNFVTFLSKSYFQKLFFAYFEMFTITSDTFKPVLNQSSKHLEVFFFFFLLKLRFPDKNSNHWQAYLKKVLSKFNDKYQKIRQ